MTDNTAPDNTAPADASSTATTSAPHPSTTESHQLVDSWLALWNGDYAQAERIIAPQFRLHAAMMDGGDGSAVDSSTALVGWISATRGAMPDLTFTVEVGPIIDGDHVVVRWRAQATYAGGMPGAQAPIGTKVDFTGTDILRIVDGKIAEYWVNSDTLLLLTQLQVGA